MSKAEKTKRFIIEKTAPLFNCKGLAGTSLSDITHCTGLTKGSIYGNFADKDELAIAVFEFNVNCIKGLLQKELATRKTVLAKLLAYAEVYGRYTRSPFPQGGCPVLNTAIEADDTHDALKHKASEVVIGWKGEIARLIDKGIKSGELDPRLDCQKAALCLIAMMEGSIMIARLTGNSGYRKSLMDSIISYIESFQLKKK